jgi:hypothetical protein
MARHPDQNPAQEWLQSPTASFTRAACGLEACLAWQVWGNGKRAAVVAALDVTFFVLPFHGAPEYATKQPSGPGLAGFSDSKFIDAANNGWN